MNMSGLPQGITRAANTRPRMRSGLRTQTGPLTGGKGLAHLVDYAHMADGGQPPMQMPPMPPQMPPGGGMPQGGMFPPGMMQALNNSMQGGQQQHPQFPMMGRPQNMGPPQGMPPHPMMMRPQNQGGMGMMQGMHPPGMTSPAAQQLAAQGQGPDNSLAHISNDEMQMLARFRGGTEINPQTGLPQFGWLGNLLKGLVRAGATIAGGMIAGPAGAAIGSGLSTKLTGGSWNDALKGAAMSGIGSFGAQGLSGQGWSLTGASNPNVTGIGGVDGDTVHQTIGNSIFQPEGSGSALAGETAAHSLPSYGTQFMNYARSAPGIAGALGSLSTPLEGTSSTTAASPLIGPQFSVKPMQRTQRPYTGDLSKYGQGPSHQWYDDINPAPEFGPAGIPGGVDYSGMDQAVPGFAAGGNVGLAAPTSNALMQAIQMGYMAAKDGGAARGPVRGPGGGQDDLIPAQLSNGEHVVTAREISALGDGDNETGQQRMYALRKQILGKAGYKNTDPKKQTKPMRGVGKFKLTPQVAA